MNKRGFDNYVNEKVNVAVVTGAIVIVWLFTTVLIGLLLLGTAHYIGAAGSIAGVLFMALSIFFGPFILGAIVRRR